MARRSAVGGSLVLDSEGVRKAADGDPRARAFLRLAARRDAAVVVSAVTLTEVLRGHPRDATRHRVLAAAVVEPVTPEDGRRAGALLGGTGLGGATVDAVVATLALRCPGPVVILTSDTDDLSRLVHAQGRNDITVAHV